MRVLAVVHGSDVRPEQFGEVIEADGHELIEWDIRASGRPPRTPDAVMVFGGDQNVGEEVRHPWLNEEYDALRGWVGDGVPLLGVCLGAQTLAHAFGGKVRRLPVPLAGFYASELTDAGSGDRVLGVLPRRFDAFNANGYTFSVPDGAVTLATGPVPQAYRLGGRAWGVQFHPEIRRDHVVRWFEDDPELPRPLDELRAELDERLPAWQELGARLCRAFLSAAQE